MYKHLHFLTDYDIKWDIFADTHAWLFLTWDDSNGYIGAVSSPVVRLKSLKTFGILCEDGKKNFFHTVHITANSYENYGLDQYYTLRGVKFSNTYSCFSYFVLD